MVPAGATAAGPSSASTAGAGPATDAESVQSRPVDAQHSPFEDMVPLAVEEGPDGDTIAGGIELPENDSARAGLQQMNGTLTRVADESVSWKRTFSTSNATTQVTDVAVGPNGDVYALVSTRDTQADTDPPETTVEVVHATSDGDVTWRYELNASARSALGASGDTLRATDQGVAVTHALPDDDGVRLAELSGGDPIWNETYETDASPTTLRTTDDGYLVAGSVRFSNPWVLRTGQSGQVEFNRTVRGAVDQRVVGAVPTDDGGVILAGSQSNFGGRAASTNTWVSRLDDDGVTRWSRLYGTANETRVQQVFTHRSGILLLEQGRNLRGDNSTTRLRAVDDDDGHQVLAADTTFDGYTTAATRMDGDLRLVGVGDPLSQNLTAVTSTVPVPSSGSVDQSGLEADTGITTNETVYRGQNLRIADRSARGDTYELVRLPGERDDFEPRTVRRIEFDGEAVLESATLPDGEYVLRNDEGEPLVLDNGRVADAGTQSEAAFRVESQEFFRLDTNRTFVDAAAGEDRVSLSLRSERTDYTLLATATDVDGESVSADELRNAFGSVDGFDGVETVNGQPVARLEVDGDVSVNVSAAAFDAGLYDVTLSGADTREAGASASGRLVVARDANRTLGLSLNESSLTVPLGGTDRVNLTLSGVDNGISALSASANRTGEPAVWPDLDLEINATRLSAGAGGGDRRARASATALQGSTGNGTVTVGTLGVDTNRHRAADLSTGNNTITLSIDWVVDEDGIPYAVPNSTTVPVEVVEQTNETSGEPSEGGVGVNGGSDDGEGSSSSEESGSDSEASADGSAGDDTNEDVAAPTDE
ncbi:hypothetical protein BRD06_07225 [Halobacteriales archaeon QS_9_67_15]|nr:MAG: hypothetical protein BRD06_07225 [Halobacteriales archaeon QS_9_67_15]